MNHNELVLSVGLAHLRIKRPGQPPHYRPDAVAGAVLHLLNFFRRSYPRYGAVFFLLFIIRAPSYAQNDSLFNILPGITYPVAAFEVGPLGELYLIDTDNQLKKISETGDSVGVFNQVTKYGKLSYVVARNPWKTLLYYQNFSTIVILDRFLKVTGTINLRAKNMPGVTAVTASYDNHIWLFDEQESKLKKIDDNGNTLLETVDLRSIFRKMPTPIEIIDQNGYVYLSDPEKGIYIFDYYGSFKSRIAYTGWKDVSVIGKDVYGFDEEKMYKYTLPLPDAETYTLPPALRNSTSIKLVNHKIYVLKDQRLHIYSAPSLQP